MFNAAKSILKKILVVTGMRVDEAIALDRSDFDSSNGLIIILKGKFGKSRELPLHSSTVDALRCYLRRRDRPPLTGDNTRVVRLHLRHPATLLQCSVDLRPVSLPCRHQASFGIVPTQTP